MKIRALTLALIVTAASIALFAGDNPAKTATPASNPAFEKMKSLLGTWEAKLPDGKTARSSYRLVSAGSAIVLTQEEPGEGGEMVTVIHPDGAQLMATHYCSAKNQPRFVAEPSSDPSTINFKLKDITNLASPEAGHMTAASIKMLDADHHSQTWTYRENGKDMTETFQLTRVK